MENDDNSERRENEIPSSSRSENVDADQGKKHCTSSHGGRSYLLPGEVPSSPPKFVSLEELMKAANGMTNMALAHEIAVNKDFKLEKLELAENSIEKTVRDTMHQAFWDILQSELNEDPPLYTQALVLLNDVRHGLLDLLLPQHTKIREQIAEVLDIDLIKQQADAGTLDFQQYAQYVISVMSKLCAPVRDERIAELMKMKDVVEVFKGILETIDLMKIDMANFTISIIRPQIIASSVQYEKQKFADFLQLQNNGLAVTTLWLGRHLNAAGDNGDIKRKIENVINDAYLELIEWNEKNVFPETLTMDENRILELTKSFKKLTIVGTILLLTYSHIGTNLSSVSEFKLLLKDNLITLLNNNSEGDLKNILADICVKLEDDIKKAFEKYSVSSSSTQISNVLDNLKIQVLEIEPDNHKIINLLRTRVREFLLSTITSRTAEPMKIPPGMSSLQQELTQLAGSFLRLISHNRAVFGEYYDGIITRALSAQINSS